MKLLRSALCLVLSLVLLAAGFPSAAAPPDGTLLLMQAGTASALVNGSTVSFPVPVYADNGAILVPLRAVAEQLGASVGWDAPVRQTTLTLDGVTLRFTDRSWRCDVDGRVLPLTAAPRVLNGALYVPLTALGSLPGIYVHGFNYYEGAVFTISDYPLIEADRAGTENFAFDAAAPDAALLQCRDAALAAFGPNEGLFRQSSLVLRLGSRHAWTGGLDHAICAKGGDILPFQGSDGFWMLPVRFCAEALGGTYVLGRDGSSTVTLGGHTAVFPAAKGYITVDGQRLTHSYYAGTLKNGTAYCSAYAFASALGLYSYIQGDSLLLSRWDLAQRPAFQAQAWQAAAGLVLQKYEDAKGFLALTFDDGPSGAFTTRLLDGLKARDVHATFFLCNYRIQTYPGILPRYLAEGHELGNHSANHATLTACSAASLAAELEQTSASIQRLAGVSPVLMRPPGGAYNQTVLSAAGARGMSCIMWSVDTLDWKNRNQAAILQRTLGTVRDGDIILMHDMYASSVDAALSMIDTLQAQGYVFVTVSELARLKGASLTPGFSYSSLR